MGRGEAPTFCREEYGLAEITFAGPWAVPTLSVDDNQFAFALPQQVAQYKSTRYAAAWVVPSQAQVAGAGAEYRVKNIWVRAGDLVGGSLQSAVRVSPASEELCSPTVAVVINASDEYTVIWAGVGAPTGIFARRFTFDGTPQGGTECLADNLEAPSDVRAALFPNGCLIVTWYEGREELPQIRARVFNGDLTPRPEGVIVIAQAEYSGENPRNAGNVSCTTDVSGRYSDALVVWREVGATKPCRYNLVMGRRLRFDGSFVEAGPVTLFDDSPANCPYAGNLWRPVAAARTPGGGAVVAALTCDGCQGNCQGPLPKVKAYRVKEDDNSLEEYASEWVDTAGINSDFTQISIASDPTNGRFVVCWRRWDLHCGYTLKARMSQDGTSLCDDVVVISAAPSDDVALFAERQPFRWGYTNHLLGVFWYKDSSEDGRENRELRQTRYFTGNEPGTE